jgi:hypothetical protein
MSEATTPSVTWGRRALRRTAGSLGAAVVLAGFGPAIANAAGANVANPVVVALRASGHGIAAALGGTEAESVPCVTPTEAPSESVEPTESATAEPSVEPSATEPAPEVSESADPSESVESVESVEPAESVEPSESVEPAEPTEPAEDCDEPEASATPTESASPSEAAEDAEHGRLVSTVAQCAPKGKDPLLGVEGAPANHGGYVRAAAHGDTLTTPWGEYDLSTQAGADALCASFDAARDALPEETAAPAKTHGKPGKAEHGKGHQSEHGKVHVKKAPHGDAGEDAADESGED